MLSMFFDFQNDPKEFHLYTDSDWASCRTSRRSTSGGLVLHRSHLVGHWSKVQGKIAPSSGEAELMAANLGLSSLAGIVQLQLELDQSDVTAYKLKHFIDASACKGMLLRRGVGAIKHLKVRDLWGQEIVRRLGVLVTKFPRGGR